MRESIFERFVFDCDGRKVRNHRQDAVHLVIGLAGFAREDIERAEHGSSIGRENWGRPGAADSVINDDLVELGPAWIHAGVGHEDGIAGRRGRTTRSGVAADHDSVESGHERPSERRSRAESQCRCFRMVQEDRARQPREMVFKRAGDRAQRLVERNATRDLLEDLGLVGGEERGSVLTGDVVTDGLELDDVAALVEERSVGPAVPPARTVAGELPIVVGLHFGARTESLQAFELVDAGGRRMQIDEQ